MSQPDPLAGFFEAQAAPEVDPVFKAEVMLAVERRRLRIRLAWRFAAAVLLALILSASAPALVAVMERLSGALDGVGGLYDQLSLALAAAVGFTALGLAAPRLLPGLSRLFPRRA